MPQKLTVAEFVSAWQRCGSARVMALEFGMSESSLQGRRRRLQSLGYQLPTRSSPEYESKIPEHNRDDRWTFPRERQVSLDTGSIVVVSDCHYWPGNASVAHKAALAVIGIVNPRVMVLNGDVFDGGSIGRHDPFGWSDRPSVKQELEACQERLDEFVQALPKGCERLWNIGNHDMRFERNLVVRVPDYANMFGMRLADHFPEWEMQWSALVNNEVMIKHRFAGGVHAAYNNTMKGGLSMVTGHTHLLEVKPWGDYRGRRWGVQTGTLADHHGPQLEYTENSPSAACSGFAVLTFRDGRLLPPELCEVIDDKAYFRGEVVA